MDAARKAGTQESRVSEAIDEMLAIHGSMNAYFTPKFLENVPEYRVLQRVIDDQTKVLDDGTRIPRDKSEISASSVQNPFETTATYRFKRGHHHGYVINEAEAVDGDGNGIVIQAEVGWQDL